MSPLYRGPFVRAQGRACHGCWSVGNDPRVRRHRFPRPRKASACQHSMPGVKGWPSHGLTEAPGERAALHHSRSTVRRTYWEPANTLRGSLLVPMVSHGVGGAMGEWTDPVSGEVVPNFTMMT